MTAGRDTLALRFERAKIAAAGRWPDILAAQGIAARFLSKRAGPCPACGGRDRFSFDDRRGHGDFFCRGCGPGDGFDLIARCRGVSRTAALAAVESFLGLSRPVPAPIAPTEPASRAVPYHLRIWAEARPLSPDDPVWHYLTRRGLDPRRAGSEIRCHPCLPYVGADRARSSFPAMIARLTDGAGVVRSVHRTYLTPEGAKADVESPKKLTSGPTGGAVVRLSAPRAALGLAEGIETALACQEMFQLPVWACIGTANMARLDDLPKRVTRVVILGDNDAGFAGQSAAYELAHRLYARGLRTEVRLPPRPGRDWLDEYRAASRRERGG